jgi:hypothetical protein
MRRAYTISLLTLLFAAAQTGIAHAGEYTIHNCPASLQSNLEAGPWQALSEPPSTSGFQPSCTPGSILGTSIGWYGSEQSLNGELGATLQSPSPAITIRGMRLVWSVSHQSSGSDTFAQIVSNTGVELIASTPYSANASDPTVVNFPAGTDTVSVYSYCSYDQSTNCYFPSATSPIITLEGMDTTLEDTSPPTATINGGALADAVVSGTASLQFTASDELSGVREAQLLIDGHPVVTHSYSNQCTYTSFAACPQSQTDTMTWETGTIPNGEHQLGLDITDAAGNSQIIDEHPILVSNPTTAVGSSGGSPHIPACAAAPGTHTEITVQAKHDLVVSDYQKQAQLRGTLVGPSGKPIPDVAIEALARPAVGSAGFSALAHITTGPKGRFDLKLPVGVSRTVCLRYRELPEGRYSAAREVTQQVRAGVTLEVHPPAVESNGTIILTGNVLGGYIPSAGKVVELLVFYLGEWRVFQTVRTSPDGQFTSFYSFLGGLGTFAFRARVRGGENGYPYVLGYSNPVKVRAG